MSDKTNIFTQVQGELKQQKLKTLKGQLKNLMEEHEKAETVRKGIEDKIVLVLEDSGMSSEEISQVLSD